MSDALIRREATGGILRFRTPHRKHFFTGQESPFYIKWWWQVHTPEPPASSSRDTHRDPPIVRVPPSKLDRGLVRLCAGIAKEGLVGARILAQPIGQLRLTGGVIQVAHVMNFPHLAADGLGQFGIVVPERARGDAGHEVEILPTGVVGEGGTTAGNEGDGIPTVGLLDAGVEELGGGVGSRELRGRDEGGRHVSHLRQCCLGGGGGRRRRFDRRMESRRRRRRAMDGEGVGGGEGEESHEDGGLLCEIHY